MARPAWHAAEALIQATARLERRDSDDGWNWRGTAFFITCSTLLTCAHVVTSKDELRVVWHDGKRRRVLPVTVASRHPATEPVPDGPYRLPDVAVLETTQPLAEFPMVWLDKAAPGEDLWAYGFTDEYRDDVAVGHWVRFRNAGKGPVDEEGGQVVWRMTGERVRPGMSGAPVLDLATGRVVGIVKRTQDATQAIGAFVTGMDSVLSAIPESLAAANYHANATPQRDDAMAIALWGDLVSMAAAPLIDSAAARDAIADELGLHGLHGDDRAQARRLARELFVVDLDRLVDCVTRLANIVSSAAAYKVFEAVATCTSHQGQPWVAAPAAAEIGAQVDQLAGHAGTVGRVLHLRSAEPRVRNHYVNRGDRRRRWWRALCSGPFSHEIDPESGLPADLERELRIATARRFPADPRCEFTQQDELDGMQSQAWNARRPGWLSKLRKQGVVGLLSSPGLDAMLVDALVERYPIVFLVAFADDVPAEVAERPTYQRLDPGVDDALASDAIEIHGAMCLHLNVVPAENLTL